jgi:hypothetical protein
MADPLHQSDPRPPRRAYDLLDARAQAQRELLRER